MIAVKIDSVSELLFGVVEGISSLVPGNALTIIYLSFKLDTTVELH